MVPRVVTGLVRDSVPFPEKVSEVMFRELVVPTARAALETVTAPDPTAFAPATASVPPFTVVPPV